MDTARGPWCGVATARHPSIERKRPAHGIYPRTNSRAALDLGGLSGQDLPMLAHAHDVNPETTILVNPVASFWSDLLTPSCIAKEPGCTRNLQSEG